eukprot:CAMPEP_0171098724 /NCGR_PEP_ID=MMETSP0766_2-20121228/49212_1 /TAXON_ID=439317 /ORGANISM="Gambierdiscus australes, Strain CAWD 149" /LENGTH=223 /DNA_ID=CAMNT_0011558141 /DNA_START=54 /DNA_END=726 /DNA_ORIENTATION=+
MVSARKTRAVGHAAAAFCLGSVAYVAKTFVTPSAPRTSSLRSDRAADVYQTLTVVDEPVQQALPPQWGAVLAAFGLAAVVAATPVRAQEATEAEDSTPGGPYAAKRKKASRPKVSAKVAPGITAQDQGSLLELPKDLPVPSLPKLELPSFSVPAETAPQKKVIISPADEIDPDEIPLAATNTPALILLFFGPSFVYTVFWVLARSTSSELAGAGRVSSARDFH